ncbi:carboxypeptidase-like regulatory domain-containing protein [Dyadobacter flavalbus]|uniref:Carboxypeptidase-like regulatory domain-containing protein n=1 Tax=Dyadobacter flavalbus TaxID=2579942 RepID=A0A5M8QZE8_9BACT|nr:carboxypeptidase-like regulatory domain-containing protein [Dyadobacter flavalbus]KAA6441589.1 carboxypeptidase-like regulatory domain-containing protein [Dyadobacter flavalbus]
MKRSLLIFLVLAVVTCFQNLYAQGEQKAIIFSGVVVGGKTTERLPGATIFIVNAGRGTLAKSDGSFTIPVFPGDSIIFSYVGFKKQYHVVPRSYNSDIYSAIVALREDVVTLSGVTIYPYSTEEEFKKAFLTLKLPDQADRDALARSTDPDYINRMAAQVPNNAQTNYRYSMDQLMFGRESAANKGFATTFPFLNPFAWASFIKSVKNGDLKQKEWRKELNAAPRENITKQDFIPPTPENDIKRNGSN